MKFNLIVYQTLLVFHKKFISAIIFASDYQFLCKLGSKRDFFNSAPIIISNTFLDQKTILAQILSCMEYKYSIYGTPPFWGFYTQPTVGTSEEW